MQLKASNSEKAVINLNDETTIKSYFVKILELHKSGEEYPVCLDDVWPLCYSEKGKAVRALESNFIENVDFIIFAQNGKKGRPIKLYKLTTSCLEFFVARKVKEVFEVYRQVFHKTADAIQQAKPMNTLDFLQATLDAMKESNNRISAVESKIHELEAKNTTRPDYFTIAGYGSLHHIPVNITLAAALGRKATAICKERGIQTDTVPDPRFGTVKMYPRDVLEEVFNTHQLSA